MCSTSAGTMPSSTRYRSTRKACSFLVVRTRIFHSFLFSDNCFIGDNGTLTFWDYNTGTPFQNMEDVPQPGSLEAEAGVFCSTFDQTGTRLITGGADKTIKVGGHFRYLDNRVQNLRRCFSRYMRNSHSDMAIWLKQ